jgi:hypothetical protein
MKPKDNDPVNRAYLIRVREEEMNRNRPNAKIIFICDLALSYLDRLSQAKSQ